MPELHFTTFEGNRQVDAERLDLPDLEAARGMALKILSRAAIASSRDALHDLQLETRAETGNGRPLLRVTLTLTSTPTLPNPPSRPRTNDARDTPA